MAQSSLRRTKLPNGTRSRDLLSELSLDNLSVDSVGESTVEALCEEYPFDGQPVYLGQLRYEEEGMWETGRTLSLEFEIRGQSRLFIFKSEVDFSVETLIEDINHALADDIRIYHNLTVNRERLWDFLHGADRILDISVLSEGEEKQFDEFEEINQSEIVGQYPIEGATVAYQYQDHQIIVRYKNGSINVQSDWAEATEYIIQIFERDVLNHRDIK